MTAAGRHAHERAVVPVYAHPRPTRAELDTLAATLAGIKAANIDARRRRERRAELRAEQRRLRDRLAAVTVELDALSP